MMRDKIEEIILGAPSEGAAADAIISALPDMIPNLEWEECSFLMGPMQVERQGFRAFPQTGGQYCVTENEWWGPSTVDTICDGIEHGKEQANKVYCASIMEAMGVTV